MTTERLEIFNNYVQYLYGTGLNYYQIGRYIKHVRAFLENSDSLTRSGYKSYKKANAEILCDSLALTAICNLLSFMGVGFKRKMKVIEKNKPLDKLSLVSLKNQGLLKDFTHWLHDENDFSVNTVSLYYYTIKNFFEYSNEFNLENAKRFLKTLEKKGFSPKTINSRINGLEKFSVWLKKPIKLTRPKFHRDLNTDNIPTESEYNKLLTYLAGKKNKDYYFHIKILASTGARISEFLQFRWEDVLNGEVILKGKGNKYRRFFFSKQLRKEVSIYIKENNKTGLVALGRFGPMTSRGFAMNMKSWGDKVNIDRNKMHPHALRHFFAKMYLKKSKDVVQLADLLGHGSIDTTRIYLQKSREEQIKDFNRNVDW